MSCWLIAWRQSDNTLSDLWQPLGFAPSYLTNNTSCSFLVAILVLFLPMKTLCCVYEISPLSSPCWCWACRYFWLVCSSLQAYLHDWGHFRTLSCVWHLSWWCMTSMTLIRIVQTLPHSNKASLIIDFHREVGSESIQEVLFKATI